MMTTMPAMRPARAQAALPTYTPYLCPIPFIPEGAGTVRRHARTVLNSWKVNASAIEDAVLVISELVTNAVVHALPPAVLRLSLTRRDGCRDLHIEITDGGPQHPSQRSPENPQPEEHGRGFSIVTALCTDSGIQSHSGKTTRWVDINGV